MLIGRNYCFLLNYFVENWFTLNLARLQKKKTRNFNVKHLILNKFLSNLSIFYLNRLSNQLLNSTPSQKKSTSVSHVLSSYLVFVHLFEQFPRGKTGNKRMQPAEAKEERSDQNHDHRQHTGHTHKH